MHCGVPVFLQCCGASSVSAFALGSWEAVWMIGGAAAEGVEGHAPLVTRNASAFLGR